MMTAIFVYSYIGYVHVTLLFQSCIGLYVLPWGINYLINYVKLHSNVENKQVSCKDILFILI